MAHGGMVSWGVSLVATVASTYALDAFAAATGATLARSGVLAGVGRTWVVVLLVVSYAA